MSELPNAAGHDSGGSAAPCPAQRFLPQAKHHDPLRNERQIGLTGQASTYAATAGELIAVTHPVPQTK